MKGMMKIMLTFPTVAALLAAVTTRSCRAFVMQQPIHHCCAASRTTGMMRSSSSLMKRSTCHQNRETTNKMSDMSVSNRNKDKTSNNAMTMETVRACRARLAALGRVSKLNPNGHTATISKAAGETAYAFPVIGSSDQRRRRAAPRMAPRAVLKRGEKSGAGSIKMGLSRARRALHQVLGRGSSVAQISGAVGIGIAGGSGQQPPKGASPQSSVDLEEVLQHSKLLMKDEDPERAKRVLILMSDTGGGHRASAQALKEAFDDLYPGAVDVSIVDIWTEAAPWPLNRFVPAYQFMAKRPLIWRAFWQYGRFPPARRMTTEISNLQCHSRFKTLIEDSDPDLVISVHPLCQDLPMRVMKNIGGGRREIPFVTVVTDLGGAHPTWFNKEIDACFVPSERLAQIARSCGLSRGQIRLHGLPIRPGFAKQQPQQQPIPTNSRQAVPVSAEEGDRTDKAELQRKLGLKPGVKACLVVGGGDGVGGLQSIAASVGSKLGEEGIESQVVVVCGTNERVKASLEEESWASHVDKHVKGFVSNMDEWMGAVDCIVTKAGPGTIAEATTQGLPVMLSAFLPGQEAGNVPYVTEGGFGAFSRNPAKIAETVSGWLKDDNLRAEMSRKAKAASRPHAAYDICLDIGEMLGLGSKMRHPSLPKSIPAMA